MSLFSNYFRLGLEHITDPGGYDHIVYLAALAAVFSWRQWRLVALLATAFTLGHSLALAVAVLGIFRPDTAVVELLIPVTILITAVQAAVRPRLAQGKAGYTVALVFGLVHGLGFSTLLISLLGEEGQLAVPLLGFNLGLEAGQLIILAILLVVNWLITKVLRVPANFWRLGLCILAGLLALHLLADRLSLLL